MSLSQNNDGILQLKFVPGTQTGFAVEKDRLIKTIDNGEHWSLLMQNVQANFREIEFPTVSTGFVRGANFIKLTNGGADFTTIYSAPGNPSSMSFLDENKGWISVGGTVFSTTNGGLTWNQKSSPGKGARFQMTFQNDSTAYAIGGLYQVYKTTDAGKYWEPVIRDNNFEYFNYSHNTFYLLKTGSIWAGGGHGFIERAELSSVTSHPVADFSFDTSDLNNLNKLKFVNNGKPGYVYHWYHNDILFSTNYNAEFISSRLTIDTFRLVVIKGVDSVSRDEIYDTRLDKTQCFSSFSFVTDTSSVKFNPGFTVPGVIHSWDFGDGNIDSNVTAPVHIYARAATYQVTHKVYNPVDRCSTTTTLDVTIQRTQNCLIPSFTMVADSFYTNHLVYYASYDKSTELFESNIHTYSWDFGNGEKLIV